VGRVVAVPCWSQSRHHQTTVSTDAIASILINSVAGRQRITVMVPGPFPRRVAVRSCGVGSRPMSWSRSAAGSAARGEMGSTRDRPGLGEVGHGPLGQGVLLRSVRLLA
jgi:hypothetical protein